MPELFFTLATVAVFVCIGIFAAAGIRYSAAVQNRIGKPVLTVLFSLVLVAAVLLAISVPVIRGLLLSS